MTEEATGEPKNGWLGGSQGIYSATAVVLLATVLAKILALVRDVLIAGYYGASDVTDAFYLALTVPAILVSAFGGTLSTSLIPVTAGVEAKEGREGAVRFFGVIFQSSVLMALIAGGATTALAAPIVRALGPDLDEHAIGIAIVALRWLGLWTVGHILAQTLTGIFQSQKKFVPPAICLLVDTAGVIGVLVLAESLGASHALPIAWVGGMAAMTCIFVSFYVRVIGYRPTTSLRSPHLGGTVVLAVPIMMCSVLSSLPGAIDRYFASGLPEGSIAALSYGFMLLNVPLYLLILPASTAALPFLSQEAQAGTSQGVDRIVVKLVRATMITIVPVVFFTAMHAVPLVRLVYERGAFDLEDTRNTAIAMMGFCPALFPIAAISILSRVFFSYKDARSVVFCLLVGVAVKIAVSILLIDSLGIGGLALATSAALLVTMTLMSLILRKKIGRGSRRTDWRPIGGGVFCSVLALGALEGARHAGIDMHILVRGSVFVLIYAAAYLGLVPGEGRQLRNLIRRLRRRD